MSGFLLAGGGTSGHVIPLLSVARALRAAYPEASISVIGTAEGLESRLVPEAGFELVVIPRVPFPRRPNRDALAFPFRYRRAVRLIRDQIDSMHPDAVVGFGGYASAPAYRAARRRVPIVVHEANARPGLANRLGARWTPYVGVAFAGTPLPHARLVGMPLRPEIEHLDRHEQRAVAARAFGLDADRPVLLVTTGSLGSLRVNEAILGAAKPILDAGWQILHVGGSANPVPDPHLDGYRMFDYLDRMDLALALADFAVARAGASTVSEFTALGIPAIYVPLPFGNGEQRFNALDAVDAGAAILVDDADVSSEWANARLVPLLGDRSRIDAMTSHASRTGIRDGSGRMVELIREAMSK